MKAHKYITTVICVLLFIVGNAQTPFPSGIRFTNVTQVTTIDSIPVMTKNGIIKSWIPADSLRSGTAPIYTAGANIQISSSNVISATDTNTTYGLFNTVNDGLVPKRVGATTTRYLREDGSWQVPPVGTTLTPVTLTALNTGTETTTRAVTAKILNDWLVGKNYSTQTLTAGANIQINGNVISATNTIYGIFNDTSDGLVPKRIGATTNKFLNETGTWEVPSGSGQKEYKIISTATYTLLPEDNGKVLLFTYYEDNDGWIYGDIFLTINNTLPSNFDCEVHSANGSDILVNDIDDPLVDFGPRPDASIDLYLNGASKGQGRIIKLTGNRVYTTGFEWLTGG